MLFIKWYILVGAIIGIGGIGVIVVIVCICLLILIGVTILIIVCVSKKKGKGYSIFSKYNFIISIHLMYIIHFTHLDPNKRSDSQ